MIRPYYIPPSLLVEGLFCKRRLWLKANNVEIFEEKQDMSHAKTLKMQMRSEDINDQEWYYEARLPSGSRIDAWVPEEAVGIEFKSGRPHISHLYQVWALRQELLQLGVKEAEMQLWYPITFEKEAEKLARYYHLDYGSLTETLFAICTEKEDPDFMLKMERASAILIGELEEGDIPGVKEPSSPICQSCSYYTWCYAGEPVKHRFNHSEEVESKQSDEVESEEVKEVIEANNLKSNF